MARIQLDELLRGVAREAGHPDTPPETVQRVTEATLSALASKLPMIDLRALQRCLPEQLEDAVCVSETRDSFFDHVARAEHDETYAATEHAEAVLRALGRLLDDDVRARLKEHLPADVGVLLNRESKPDRIFSVRRVPGGFAVFGRGSSKVSQVFAKREDAVAEARLLGGSVMVDGDTGHLVSERI